MEGTQRKTLVILLILVLVVVVAIFVVIDTNSNGASSITGNVIKTLKNCKNVEVPYTITEQYEYYLQGRVIEAYQKERLEVFGKGIYQEGKVQLKNIDNEAGWFTVKFRWETLNNQWTDSIRHYVEPDETIDFLSIYDTSIGEDTKFTYIFKAEPITKTRTVTKYRTEERCD